jgi:hypothetical protein
VGRLADDVLAVEQDLAGGGLAFAGQAVEQAGLAGAVGADDGVDGAGAHFEVNAATALNGP